MPVRRYGPPGPDGGCGGGVRLHSAGALPMTAEGRIGEMGGVLPPLTPFVGVCPRGSLRQLALRWRDYCALQHAAFAERLLQPPAPVLVG